MPDGPPPALPLTSPDALFAHALAAFRAGRHADADAACKLVLATRPDHAEALHLAGLVAHQQRRLDAAVALLCQALEVDPSPPHFHRHLALVLSDQGQHEAAEARAREALRLQPDYAEAQHSLAVARLALGYPAEAEAHAREAIRLRPDYAEAHQGLAVILGNLDRIDAALASCEVALRLQPTLIETLNNRGTLHLRQNRLADAMASYRAAIALRPDDAGAHANLGLALLRDGQFAEGWQEYEHRWRTGRMGPPDGLDAAPLWDGAPLGTRVLLLWAEQGLGDTLQFCRYAPLVARQVRLHQQDHPCRRTCCGCSRRCRA